MNEENTRFKEIKADLAELTDEQLDEKVKDLDLPEDLTRNDVLNALAKDILEKEQQQEIEEAKAILQEANALIEKGHFAKAENLMKTLSPDKIPEVISSKLKAALEAKKAEQQKPKTETKAKAKSKSKAKSKAPEKPKEKTRGITHESILDSLDQVIADLAELEVQQRGKNKPFRHVFFTRRRLEQTVLNFRKATMKRTR